MPVAAPADKRFRRARVNPKRRRSWRSWRPSWWTLARLAVVCVVLAFGMYRAVGLVLSAQALTVNRITVRGNEHAEFDLPIIDGLASARAGATLVDESRAALAGRLIADLQRRPDLANRISQIDVTDARDAVVILKGDTALVRVGDERFIDRIQSYVDLMPALRARVPDIDYVDLRFDERVYVRPSRGRGRRPSGS
jgi:cell division septal protein FtsQ